MVSRVPGESAYGGTDQQREPGRGQAFPAAQSSALLVPSSFLSLTLKNHCRLGSSFSLTTVHPHLFFWPPHIPNRLDRPGACDCLIRNLVFYHHKCHLFLQSPYSPPSHNPPQSLKPPLVRLLAPNNDVEFLSKSHGKATNHSPYWINPPPIKPYSPHMTFALKP